MKIIIDFDEQDLSKRCCMKEGNKIIKRFPFYDFKGDDGTLTTKRSTWENEKFRNNYFKKHEVESK